MYPRKVTEKILELQAKGFTGEETQTYLKEHGYPKIHLNTIYNQRVSPLAQDIIDEKIRQQDRRILRQEEANPELALRYANEQLKILIPQRAEIITKSLNINKNETTLNVTSDLLKQYEGLFEEAALLEHCAPQPIHTPQTNNQTSSSTST